MRLPVALMFLLPALPAMAAGAGGEQSPRLVESPLSTSMLLETTGALIVVLLLIMGLAWLVRRSGKFPGIGRGPIQVLGTLSLGTRERVVLVSVEGTRLLLGVAPGSIRTLHVLTDTEQAENAEQATVPSFEETLAAVGEEQS